MRARRTAQIHLTQLLDLAGTFHYQGLQVMVVRQAAAFANYLMLIERPQLQERRPLYSRSNFTTA